MAVQAFVIGVLAVVAAMTLQAVFAVAVVVTDGRRPIIVIVIVVISGQ